MTPTPSNELGSHRGRGTPIDAQYGVRHGGWSAQAGLLSRHRAGDAFFETTVEDFDKVMAINVRGIKGDDTWRL